MGEVASVPSILAEYVRETARWLEPSDTVWCWGTDEEAGLLSEELAQTGRWIPCNPDYYPNCFVYRSDPSDVARTEKSTYIVTADPEEAGPNNNWMSPREARERVWSLFQGAMRGKTMYVVPYLMGPPDSPFARAGVELTDSPYVVLSMRIMTRVGAVALQHIESTGDFVRGVHALKDLDPANRYILHWPREKEIWSINTGYGGNALLGKKCFGLRIASWLAKQEGWLAEHMLILGIEFPDGQTHYVAAAFPSACGKTNLAMLVPPRRYTGFKVWTVGDDIAWIRPGEDGRLWAVNPEAGFFGVLKGTNPRTNPRAMATFQKNSIFTNTGLTPDRCPWWEGLTDAPPEGTFDWQGRPWQPGAGPVAHPNARFTAPARQCPSIAPNWEDPQGVPLTAILFGGRRKSVAPLVYEAFDWEHGVFVGATMASETTAAQSGAVGVVRRDPMAMLPFCGYNMADYFRHWIEMGRRITRPPRIFHVNWFRTDEQGRFLWPGFGENFRVLLWILARCAGQAEARPTAIGYVPPPTALDLADLAMSPGQVEQLLSVSHEEWRREADEIEQFLARFGSRLPKEISHQLSALRRRLAAG